MSTTTNQIPTKHKFEKRIGTDFKVHIDHLTWENLMHWCQRGEKRRKEVSGLACVNWDQDSRTFTVHSPVVLDEGTSAQTEIDPVILGKAMFKMKDQENPGKCHWHTHPNMGTFWSGTDEDMIRQLGSQGWMIFLVLNEKQEVRAAYYELVEVMGKKHEVFADDLNVFIDYPAIDSELVAKWDKEYEAIEKKYVAPPYQTDLYGSGAKVYNPGHESFHQWERDYWRGKMTHGTSINPREHAWDKFQSSSVGNWDSNGWAWDYVKRDYSYNPVKDTKLKTDWEKCEAINDNLSADDIVRLRRIDKEFDKFYSTAQETGLL